MPAPPPEEPMSHHEEYVPQLSTTQQLAYDTLQSIAIPLESPTAPRDTSTPACNPRYAMTRLSFPQENLPELPPISEEPPLQPTTSHFCRDPPPHMNTETPSRHFTFRPGSIRGGPPPRGTTGFAGSGRGYNGFGRQSADPYSQHPYSTRNSDQTAQFEGQPRTSFYVARILRLCSGTSC